MSEHGFQRRQMNPLSQITSNYITWYYETYTIGIKKMLEMIALPLNLLVWLRVQKLPVKWYFYHLFPPPHYLTSRFHVIAGSETFRGGEFARFPPSPLPPPPSLCGDHSIGKLF